jgi:DNA-binding response OmpR family regulator
MARILIIDDSQVIRDMLTDLLTDQGHEIKTAPDGKVGASMALSGTFDLCICDLHIPKKNGYEIFTEVHAAKPSLPFVMTDSLPDHLADRALDAGAAHCLKKPFDLDQLRGVLRQVLQPVKTP